MKKRNIFLTSLLIILLAGILLSALGVMMGGRLFSFQIQESNSDADRGSLQSGTTIIDDTSAATIENIDLHVQMNNAQIISGDHFEISGDGNYSSSIQNGTWYIKTKKQIAEIRFLAHRIKIPVFWRAFWNHGADAEHYSNNTIMLPTGTKFKNAEIRVSAGDLSVMTSLCADTVNLETGAGKCEIQEILSDSLKIKTGAGQSIFHSLTVNDHCNAKVGAGSIILGSKGSGRTEIHGLNAECGAGEMEIYGKLLDTCSIDCSMGSANLTLEGNRSNYTFITEANMGDIDIDDDDHDDYDYDDDDKHHTSSASNPADTYGWLTLQCSMGDIDVGFYPPGQTDH